ncbi:hypothetical protein BDV96DRAFT_498624 [Lophiotrema nucula]|uniref:Nuclear pore complex protein Nup85 n=1 Tax=Lophiotrema nucula TaxID=690887 RepID=A0A6A5YZ89_9PLEO|nr:hypothetical protein BDV96DRAFT_498624 [Lophiotrema nucula]
MFRVPSSSPPSTPDSRRSSRNVPSTTPAGPPPDKSFMPSSTPAGAPPTGLFSNSQFGFSNPKALNFNKSAYGSSPPKNELFGVGNAAFGVSTTGRPGSFRGRSGFRVPSSTPPRQGHSEDEAEEEEDEDEGDEDMEDEDAEGEEDEDDRMEDDESSAEDDDDIPAHSRSRGQNRLSQSVVSQTGSMQQQMSSPRLVRPAAKQSQYDLLNLAKGLAPNPDRATLREPGETILETERLMEKLNESETPERREDALAEVAQELVVLWQNSRQASATTGRASLLFNASRLANLLLGIHYPGQIAQKQRPSKLSLVPLRPESRHFLPIPKVLIDWLNTYHGAISEIGVVLKETRGYSAHMSFWDAVHASACRGNFAATLKLLKGARFEVAATASEDQLGDSGYRGSHLANTNEVVGDAINLLHECPAVASEDWDIKGQDWNVFRRQVQQALADLQEYAEGDSQNRYSASRSMQASHFGMSQSQNKFNLSMASRKAESKVPWSVYENLARLYKLLLGDEGEIIALAADWIEAVASLTIWWNGEDDDAPQGSLAASRRSVARSQRLRPVDITPVQAYCQRMSAAVATVFDSEEDDFSVNVTDTFEVGLACVFDNNIEGVLHILRGWSLSLASAVAEIATTGDWFPRGDGIFDQFDQSDLMLLSSANRPPAGLTKDDILVTYATVIARMDEITGSDGDDAAREGWELAIQVLGRLNDQRVAQDRIEWVLDDLPLRSSDRVDKIIQLCHSLGLSQQARSVALKFADHLRHNTQNYGDTLLYYARAHDAAKIQEVLRVLVAHCLVKSLAYPPVVELDDSLESLITSPKKTLTDVARADPEGAQLLSNYLSGYATIRKFYDLRDEEIIAKGGEKPAHRPMARKRAAANALIVIVQSAASSIRGGLYDHEVETVVQVDVLLSLLGEALVFINQPKRTLTLQHLYSLLAAIEDLDTAPPMIRTQAEECLLTTLAAAHDGTVPSPKSLLQKSTSNLTTGSSQYSLIGSTEFGSVEGQSTESSTILVRGGVVDDAKRAWDWRKGFNKNAKGEDVIRILRLGIAKEIGRAFVEGEV